MIRFQQAVDQNGVPVVGAIPFSDTIGALVFTGAGAQSFTIPPGANLVYIGWSAGNIYLLMDGAAAVPAANASSGASEINPSPFRWLYGHTTIGIAADSACVVTLSFWS
jgi:hypothetical protein